MIEFTTVDGQVYRKDNATLEQFEDAMLEGNPDICWLVYNAWRVGQPYIAWTVRAEQVVAWRVIEPTPLQDIPGLHVDVQDA